MKIIAVVKQAHALNGHRDVPLDSGDRCGIEVGLRLREAHGGEMMLVSVGGERACEAIRRGLAMGADRATLVSDSEALESDALRTSRVLAAAISAEKPDLVLCATETRDGSMLPPMLAELLGVSLLSFVDHVAFDGGSVTARRRGRAEYAMVQTRTPCVLEVVAGSLRPRYPSVAGILSARSKQVGVRNLADLGIADEGPRASVAVVDRPKEGTVQEIIVDQDGSAVATIIDALRSARVL